ncbi:OLC1v1001333C1 [Oldenlandia corymbosa var. corymbosa]|uniref:OLC1v1001333C1 n=1 Tax=Oldenlandia corymbosa var. corymbosa TaxID=529605 RepID=A0AAV1D592_OLDCO|nr:OLC1v1001333C1 [Oldenlandia corymbosa var. corymbosa]
MVILVQKLGRSLKFHHRLDNHSHPANNHDSEEALMASFQAFQSEVSKTLGQILAEANKLGSSFLSLEWIQQCLEKLPMIERAFAKLAVDLDYPMIKWEQSASDAYLKYSLNVMELLNKISSSVSHLSQGRVGLAHGLGLVIANSPSLALKNHLQGIKPKDPGNGFKVEGVKTVQPDEEAEAKVICQKESIIHEASGIMIGSALRLLGIMISGLCSDVKPYLEARNLAGKLQEPSLQSLEFLLDQEIKQKKNTVKEVKEVNDAAAELVAEIGRGKGDPAAEKLGRKLEVLEKILERIAQQTDRMFSEVLAARSKILDTIRHK